MASSDQPLVPVIRYLDSAHGFDMEDVPKAVQSHVLRSYQKQEVAVLVSDMSGFTRLTRKYGSIHFTSIIARTRQLCLPILREHGAILITAEGDSLNVIFPRPESAVLAAFHMQRTCAKYNSGLSPEKAHFALTLDGVGVDFGPGPLLDKEGKLHGQTFANAHLLGEELCSKGKVAMSSRCAAAIKGVDAFANASFRPMALGDSEDAHEAIKAMGDVLELDMQSSQPIELASCDTPGLIQEALLSFCLRHAPGIEDKELSALDNSLRSMHMRTKTVLMFDFDYHDVDSPITSLGLKFECLARLDPIFVQHRAAKVEDVLYLFNEPVAAILTAVKCREAADKFYSELGSRPRVSIKGFGVHVGELLVIENTDVHWGDPVNTSSKLGQDHAEGGEIIISKHAYAECMGDERLHGLEFNQFEMEMSGVKFQPYKVWSPDRPSPDAQPAIGGHRAQSIFFQPADTPEVCKSKILGIYKECGLSEDTEISFATLGKFLAACAPGLSEEEVTMVLNKVQGDAKCVDATTFPTFVDWAFGA